MYEIDSAAYMELKQLIGGWILRHNLGPESICQIQTAVISLEAYTRKVPQSVVICDLINRLEHSRDDLLTRSQRN